MNNLKPILSSKTNKYFKINTGVAKLNPFKHWVSLMKANEFRS